MQDERFQRRISYDGHFANDDHLVEVTNVWRNFISDTFFMKALFT
jgi:hypothetical protein